MHTMALTMNVAARMTKAEYLALPLSPPGVRFELLDGELVTMNDPLPNHQLVAGALHAEIRAWTRAAPDRGRILLPIDTEISDDTVFGPDMQWFAADRELPPINRRPWPAGDIVVEVASPSTARYDALTKAPRYARAGVRELWLVTPDPLNVRVLTNENGDFKARDRFERGDTLTSPLLPGFALPVDALLD